MHSGNLSQITLPSMWSLVLIKQTWIRWISFIICSLSLFDVFLIILHLLFTDSLQFISVFTHEFIQLFINIRNRIKIINQVWLGLLYIFKNDRIRWYYLIQKLLNAPATCKNMEKKGKTCDWFFNTFNRWYEYKEKTQICFVGIKILNNSQNTTIITQQA